jgi:CBS domain-containing protein
MIEEGILEEETIALERTADAARFEALLLDRPIHILPGLRDPIQLDRRAPLRAAIDKMNQEKVGCVLVVDGGRLVGVFTERDVLTRVVQAGADLDEVAVEELMTRDPECLTLEDGISYALNKMTVGGFRHVPLIDPLGRPTGVIAMRHIVEYLVDLFPRDVLTLPPSPQHAIARTREGA